MIAQGLVLLSQNDADAPALPAVATVSKDDAWDDGGRGLGEAAAAQGRLWCDRPYFTGNPSIDWMVAKIDRVTDADGWAQIGNEQNLELEGWSGGPAAWRDFDADVRARVKRPDRLLAMPPSPGVAGWPEWVTPAGPFAVHAYGTLDGMRGIVEWYLENTDGQLCVTECNFGAGNAVDVDAWANDHLIPFLDWCATQPRIVAVAYFCWRWHGGPSLPTSVDAAGTAVETVIRDWRPPVNGGEGDVDDITLSVPTEWTPASPANYDAGPRAWTTGIVVHCTRGGASTPQQEFEATVDWFADPSAKVSAHLVVGPSSVARPLHDDAVAWHARTANDDHLGIEIAQATNETPISDWQYAAAAEACRRWCDKYGLPYAQVVGEGPRGLVGHDDTESGWQDGKSDPGATPCGVFDWGYFMALVTQTAQPPELVALENEVWGLGAQLMALGDRYTALGYPHRGEYARSQGNALKEWVNTASKAQK